MRLHQPLAILCFLFSGTSAFPQKPAIIDAAHYSSVFAENRNYSIFLPKDYDVSNKKYPVIYFLHGWGQRYFGEGDYKYAGYDSANDNNGDNIGNYVAAHDVIIVKSDGYNRSEGEPYYPRPYNIGPVETYRQFPLYIDELVAYIDNNYRTIADRKHRAISGLSMGGFMSFWISAKYPDKFCAAGNFCGSPEFFVGPKDFPVEYRHLDVYKNFEGVKLQLHYGDKDFIRQYHEEMNEAWLPIMDNFHSKMFPAEHSTCGMGEMFDSLMATFVHPYPKPSTWSHTDVYPNFDVWGYSISSDRIVPGFTVLENVSKNGFRSAVREFMPDGGIQSNVLLSLVTDSVYKKNTSYRITDFDHRTGGIKKYTATTDNKGRLHISVNGSLHDIGISDKVNEPDIVLDSIIILNQPWPVAGQDLQLQLKLLNRGNAIAQDIRLTIQSVRSAPKIINGTTRIAQIRPGEAGESSSPLIIKTENNDQAARLNLSIVSGKKSWFTDITLMLKRPANPSGNWVIADGQVFTVVNGGNDSVTTRLGSGNGDGKPNPGESIMILAVDSGKFYRTALTTGYSSKIPATRIRKSDYWGKFDNVGASQKFDEMLISKTFPHDSTVPVLFEYWKANGTKHIAGEGIAAIRVAGNDQTAPVLENVSVRGYKFLEAKIRDGSVIREATATFSFIDKSNPDTTIMLKDDKTAGDRAADDNVFSVTLPSLGFHECAITIEATDEFGNKMQTKWTGNFFIR